MLKQVEIENFVFFKNISLDFHSGFNVFTGETGAGKTIFLNALNLTLGGKIPANSIKVGEKKIKVTSHFNIKNKPAVKANLSELGYEVDDELVLQREVNLEGKSKARINGELTTLNQLKLIASQLIDIHSQHENQILLNPNTHLSLLDQFSNIDGSGTLKKYQELYHKNKTQSKELSNIIDRERKLQEERNFLEFTVKDLTGIIDEEKYETLKLELDQMELNQTNSEVIFEIDHLFKQAISPSLDKLKLLTQKLHQLQNNSAQNNPNKTKNNKPLKETIDKVDQINYDLESISQHLLNDYEVKDYNPIIDRLNEQLAITERKLKKYGLPINELFAKLEQTKEKLSFLENISFKKEDLEKELKVTNDLVLQKSLELHEKRKLAKVKLEAEINRELKFLGMKNGTIHINLTLEQSGLHQRGSSKAEFYYSPAKEMTAKPLKKIASGGELSRIMLAIKSIFTQKNSYPTIIFDEIDIGVGGQTALNIGQKIQNISQKIQVMVITHLPQIAKYADSHFKIEKNIDANGKTYSEMIKLPTENRYSEFARMLGNQGKDLDLARKYLNRKE